MRDDRARGATRRREVPNTRQGNAPFGVRRRARRLWPILTVLRRVERLVEEDEQQLRDENAYSAAWGGDEPNA